MAPENMPNNWNGTNCWQVVKGSYEDLGKEEQKKVGSATSKEEVNEADVIVNICAANKNEQDAWMNAIRDFHNCEIKTMVEKVEKNDDSMRKFIDEDEFIEQERQEKDEEEIEEID